MGKAYQTKLSKAIVCSISIFPPVSLKSECGRQESKKDFPEGVNLDLEEHTRKHTGCGTRPPTPETESFLSFAGVDLNFLLTVVCCAPVLILKETPLQLPRL